MGGIVGINEVDDGAGKIGNINNVSTQSSVKGLHTHYTFTQAQLDNLGLIQNLYAFDVNDTVTIGGITGYNLGEMDNCEVVDGVNLEKNYEEKEYKGNINVTNEETLLDRSVSTSSSVGGIASQNGGIIKNSVNNGKIVDKTSKIIYGSVPGDYEDVDIGYSSGLISGIAGSYIPGAKIINCSNTGDLTAVDGGGVYGIGTGGPQTYVINSYNTGKITTSAYSGGISQANVINSYNTGDIEIPGEGYLYAVGGITGQGSYNIISNSYNTGDIKGYGMGLGGLIGGGSSTHIVNSYNTGNVESLNTDIVRLNANPVTGIIANNGSGNDTIVRNVYSTGNVKSYGTTYGIGSNTGGDIKNVISFGNVEGAEGSIMAIGSNIEGVNINNVYVYEGSTLTNNQGDTDPINDVVETVDGSDISQGIIATNANVTNPSWWSDASGEGNGLGFNSYDVDGNGDLADDANHWDLSVLPTSLPKVNEVVEDSADTTGDGWTSIGSPGLVGGDAQVDIPMPLLYSEQKVKEATEDNKKDITVHDTTDVSQMQKDADNVSEVDSENEETYDESLKDEDIENIIEVNQENSNDKSVDQQIDSEEII